MLNLTDVLPDSNPWYFLDPDNRKDAPDSPHCARCMKKMKGSAGVVFISVEVHAIHPWVRKSIFGKELIGEDCWNKIVKYGEVKP